MKTTILIPARYASTRYPGKPLAMLTLPSGEKKSLAGTKANRFGVLFVRSGISTAHLGPDVDAPDLRLLSFWIGERQHQPQFSIGRLR